jgi:DNA-binding MarR family transcriptional regulator
VLICLMWLITNPVKQMTTNGVNHIENGKIESGNGPISPDQLHRLVRLSHIFSSVVREILEAKLLGEATPLPLTLTQFHILKLMTVKGHHQVSELAEFLGVSAPAVTKNINKLERFGLVLRSSSDGDRRVTRLTASLKGKRLVKKYEEIKATRVYPILESFEGEDIDRMSELLERFSVSLLKHERTGRGFCLRCAAYIETGCPVGHVRGGCPYDSLDVQTNDTQRVES